MQRAQRPLPGHGGGARFRCHRATSMLKFNVQFFIFDSIFDICVRRLLATAIFYGVTAGLAALRASTEAIVTKTASSIQRLAAYPESIA